MALPATAGLKILNAEADALRRGARSRGLRHAGAVVVEVTTGAEALRLIALEPPDAAIVSPTLPDISGFEVCRRIKSDPVTASIPVLHTTCRYSREESREASLDGSEGYIEEPDDWAAPLDELRRLVGRSQQASREVDRLRGELGRGLDTLERTVARSQRILDEPPAGLLGADRVTTARPAVLVVDDEPLVRDVTRAILERRGYAVITVEDGAAALAVIRNGGPEIGLVLLDWSMPGMGGEATVCQLQREAPDLPVIVISGRDTSAAVRAMSGSPNVGFLAKPYTADEVLRAVRAAAPKLKARTAT